MGNHFAEIDGKPHRVHRRPGQPRPGGGRGEEGRLAHADGARDHRRRAPVLRPTSSPAYDALVEKARTNTLTAGRPRRRQHHAHQPRRPRHGRLGPAPDERPGHDRRDRLDRLPAWGSENIGAMIGAEKVMTMTSTYDHRIIQGAESGRFLALIEDYLQGEHGFYEDVFASLGVELGPPRRPCPPRPPPPRPPLRPSRDGALAAAAARSCCRRCRPRRTFVSRVRSHGHLAARLDPLGSEPEGDPGPGPGGARADARDAGAAPGQDLPDVRARRDARRRAAAPARDLLRHDRLRDRAHRLPPPARVAARAHRVRRLPPAADERRAQDAAQAPGRGRRARALHAQGLPRPAPVLDRGPRHDRADARRADPAVGRARRPGGRRSGWPTAGG